MEDQDAVIDGSEVLMTLDSDLLFSKWGNYDGDIPDLVSDRLMYSRSGWADGPYPYETWDWHATLKNLVRTYLVPAIPHTLVLYEISTNHNPIRIESVDGVGWDDDLSSHEPTFPNVQVRLTADQIIAARIAPHPDLSL